MYADRLLPDLDEPEHGYSTRFWVLFTLFIITVSTTALFLFFYFVVMGHM